LSISYLQSFIAGLLISLTGSLPLGNLNVTAMQIAVRETLSKAVWFSAGVAMVEVAYLALTLSVVSKLSINENVLFFFHILSVGMLTVMAIGSFRSAGHKERKHIVLGGNINRWYLGVVMSAANPLQIPFWSGWVIYLLSISVISNTAAGYSFFALSAGMGTFAALMLFVYAGTRFAELMLKREKQINILIGCLFAFMALFQFLTLKVH